MSGCEVEGSSSCERWSAPGWSAQRAGELAFGAWQRCEARAGPSSGPLRRSLGLGGEAEGGEDVGAARHVAGRPVRLAVLLHTGFEHSGDSTRQRIEEEVKYGDEL